MTSVRLLSAFLIGLGLFGTFFFKYSNSELIPLSFLWFWLCIVLLLLGLYLWHSSPSKAETILVKEIQHLKNTGERIEVKLSDCQILSSEEHKEISRSATPQYEVFDNIFFSDDAYKRELKHNSYILYVGDDGQKYISPKIPKDEITIKFYFHKKETTYLYVNPKAKKYYFDLEFLINEI